MNEIFKKIQDVAHYANEHGREDRKMVAIIIASPDAQEDNAHLLSLTAGTGVNIIDTLIHAFDSEPKLMAFAKAAIAVVEGTKAVEMLTAAKVKADIKARLDARRSGEEKGACDADNRNREYDVNEDSGEERGPEVE